MTRKLLTPLNLPTFTADPAAPANGDMWYRSDTGKFRARQAGITADIIGPYTDAQKRDVLYGSGQLIKRQTSPIDDSAGASQMASATMHITPIVLYQNDVISSLASIYSGVGFTYGASISRMWMALYSEADALLRQTADQAAAAWTAGTIRKLTFTGGSYTVPTTGVYYAAFYWVVATAGGGTMISSPSGNNSAIAHWTSTRAALFPNAPARIAGQLALASTAVAPASISAAVLSTQPGRVWLGAA